MLKRKLTKGIGAIMVLSVVLSGCSGTAQSTKPAASEEGKGTSQAVEDVAAGSEPVGEKIEFRIASPYDTNTSMLMAAQGFVEELSKKSGGTLSGTIYAAGVMGGEQETLEAIKMGEIEMAVMGTYPIVTLAPEYGFFDAPFVFRDREHYFSAWNGKLGDGVKDIFKSNNIETLGIMGRGYRHITSNNPINSVGDLKGIKMRMGQSTPFINAFTEIEAVVVPIALPELFTSLQMGVVNASEGPFDQIYSYKLYEVQKNLALSGHLYATSLWLANDDFYEKLSEDQKEIFDECVEKWLAEGTKLSDTAEEELLDTLQQEGMTVTTPDTEELRQKALPAIEKMFESDWTVTTMDEINQY